MINTIFATRHRFGAAVVAALAALAGCDRGDAKNAAAGAEPAGGAITLWTDSTELFMEHPALIVGAPDKFAVHLTDLTDFAPLRSGRITLTFRPRDGGAPVVVKQDAPRSPGIYGPSPEFTRAGVYDLSILVDSPQAKDSIAVPALRVYAAAAEAPKEQGGTGGDIKFLKEQQWKTPGFATAFATEGDVEASFDASGVIQPEPGRFAQVSAPVSGLVDPSGVANAPAPGQRVSRGQVLAVLAPSLGEGGGAAVSDARARLREAEDEYDRARRLYEVEAVPQRRVHEAEIRLAAAREALSGYGAGAGGRVSVRSPVAGVVGERNVSPGARVEAGAPLFTIVDPSVVWLRVNVPAAQAANVSRSAGVEFRVEGSSKVYVARRVVSVGSVIDSLSRTVPVLFEVGNADFTLKVGANATVAVRTGQRQAGVVIPSSAVLDEDGRPIAYVQAEGEAFEKREITVGGRAGDRVLVRAGVKSGDRVVTGAAYQVRLASLSTSVPAHGHEH
jgi:membrane fusion protein, heavy metal efflux system